MMDNRLVVKFSHAQQFDTPSFLLHILTCTTSKKQVFYGTRSSIIRAYDFAAKELL